MGVDLKLLVFTFPHYDPPNDVAYTVLSLERVRLLFKEIREMEKLKGKVVPVGFRSYFKNAGCPKPKWGKTLVTNYGQPVSSLTVGELMSFARHPDVLICPSNRAAWAYLGRLPSEIRVALWWS